MAKNANDKKSTPDGRPIYDYEKYGQDPYMWYNQADKMREASEALYGRVQKEFNACPPLPYHRGTEPIYKYLAGMAIEILLKGIMVYNDPSLVKYDTISEVLDGHNMWTKHTGRCCKKVGSKCRLSEIESELTKKEQKFVRDLEPYVEWMGRYGIAKRRGKYETDSRTVNSKPDAANFRDNFTAIYNKIHVVLDNKLIEERLQEDEKRRKAILNSL